MMDRVQRHYAHTALRGTDPLQGLPADVRRAILTMPPTIRERLRLAPWRTTDTRRQALGEIIAERRLAYTLAHDAIPEAQPAPPVATPLSPYYRHRLAMAQLGQQRFHDDLAALDGVHSVEYRHQPVLIPYAHDKDTHAALLHIQIERARLDLAELELRAAAHARQNAAQPSSISETRDVLGMPKATRKTTSKTPPTPMNNYWAQSPERKPKTKPRGRDI